WFWGGGGASADLVYMPDNVQMVGQMHADQIMNSDALKQVYAAFPDLKKMVDENSSKSTGIDQNNVDRMYFGVAKVDGKSNTAPAAIAVIHFKNSVKVEDIEKGMKQGASSPANNAFGMSVDYSFSDSKVGRYTVTEVKQTMTFKAQPGFNPPPAPPTTLYAFTMPDDKRVVMGSPEALKAVLNRDKKPDINATLQKAIDATDWNATIAFAANVKDGFVIPPETAKTFPLPIDKVDALSATIKVGSDVDVNVTAMCKDNQAATDLSGGINTLIKAGTNSPAMASMDPALKDLMNITAQANGSNVTIAKTIKVSPLLAAAKKGGGGMMFNMFGGGFGGAPAAPDFGPPPAKPQKGK
ncbi:MAG TPA: hypothetical protein VMS17_28685, partial [Gemmataceae bacterium]|nr:hypothetical protein [Gemmataceae bacterium]